MVSSTPMPTALFWMTMCFLRCGSFTGWTPVTFRTTMPVVMFFDVNQGLVWCQWSSSNALACPEPRSQIENLWDALHRRMGCTTRPKSVKDAPLSPSRVEENTTSCHTKMYAPGGFNCLSWRLYQL
ncbi:hypothetical protein CEXT_70691 [Caerostris extrusa]|uniref:Secreted protein n=1 Tax=Caerostris extrusa TaxID=172846 RepID=A0AAV4W6G0_CAEEX|nr:hypothetical protein CEXT_70691 [Caerostris extrusa]